MRAVSVFLKHWRIMLGLPVLGVSVSVVAAVLLPPTYTAMTSFVPEVRASSRLPADVSGLAGQLGISIGTQPSQSPRFYADVVKSRELLERTLLSRYPSPALGAAAGDSVTLLEVLRVKGRSRADSVARGVKKLARLIVATADLQTNIVRLSVTARNALLAAAVANRLVAYLNEFNTKTRQSQARERRRFTEERVTAADSELRRVEDAIKTFYERNRGWQQAPELVFEEARLRRQVDVSQQVFLTLRREYETARIEEVNDTPVITVIDPAVPPQEESWPKAVLFAAAGFLFSGALAVFWAFASEYVDHMRRTGQDGYVELRRVAQRARADFRQMFARDRPSRP